MREPSVSIAAFPTAHCDTCAKTVLTCIEYDPDGHQSRRCVHCNSHVADELTWIGAAELEESGYYFGAQPPRRAGECGNGCSCSRS